MSESAGSSNPLIDFVNEQYLIKTYQICESVNIPNHNYGHPSHRVCYERHLLLENSEFTDCKAVPINVESVDSEDKKLKIMIPNLVCKTAFTTGMSAFKRRRLTDELRKKQALVIVSVDPESALIASRISKIKPKFELGEAIGPLLEFSNGKVYIAWSMAITPNQSVISPQRSQKIALNFMSFVFKDKSLVNPDKFTGQPSDLMNYIGKQPLTKSPEITPLGLKGSLLPFQRDTLSWSLNREGKQLVNENNVADMDPSVRDLVVSPPLGWRQHPESQIWFNPYLLKTLSTPPSTTNKGSQFNGVGIIAEEMGLGKTVEVISLILMNKRPDNQRQMVIDTRFNENVRQSPATLIVTPKSIALQWFHELQKFAPSLNVVTLIKTKDKLDYDTLCSADVVITTYSKISPELTMVLYDPNKHRTRYNLNVGHNVAKRSVLTTIQFWRVILDEVQMVNTGVSAAAKVVQRIPRVHAWAVSGTPIKSSLEDLRGLISFLNLQPFVEKPAWQRLISSDQDLRSTMELIGIRHTRAMVANQFHIPTQYRRLVLLKFSEVERIKYDRLYQTMLEAVESEKARVNLNSWLSKLRQLCCSASSQKSTNNETELLTMTQVLDQLIDETKNNMWAIRREIIGNNQERGQILDQLYRMPEAISLWKELLNDINMFVAELKQQKSDRITRSRLRGLQELLHRNYFFLGTGYFRSSQRLRLEHENSPEVLESEELKAELASNSEQELKYYKLAEDLRKQILNEETLKVENLLTSINPTNLQMLSKVIDVKNIPTVEAFDELSTFIMEIEARLIELLSKPLIEEDIEKTEAGVQTENDAYAKTLDEQEEASLLLELFETVLRDRAAELHNKPHQFFPVTSLNALIEDKIVRRSEILEILKIKTKLSEITEHIPNGVQVMDKIKKEINECQRQFSAIRDLYNARIQFYKQLQNLSDQVSDLDLPASVDKLTRANNIQTKNAALERELNTVGSRLRYLKNVEQDDLTAGQSRDGTPENICIICQDVYDVGLVGPCGHPFCYECFNKWLKVHSTCPVCKSKLKKEDLIVFKPKSEEKDKVDVDGHNQPSLDVKSEPVQSTATDELDLSTEPSTTSTKEIFSIVSDKFYNKILHVAISTHYGIKIDMIVKQVKYLRSIDPTTQIVIFSQWVTMLKRLEIALGENRLTAVLPENNNLEDIDKFKQDPSIACLLLSSKSDVAGLTLVNANHVFLCEPMLTTALELQAVSRISRIGQTRETFIWQFCIENSVEQSILKISTINRLHSEAELGSHGSESSYLVDAMSKGRLVDNSGSEVVEGSLLNQILFKPGND